MNRAYDTTGAMPRTFKLTLTEREIKQLFEKAGAAGMTAEQLMESFVADLTGSENAHGYDEREHIGKWFDEVLYSDDGDISFLSYLLIEGEYNRFIESYENAAAYKDEYDRIKGYEDIFTEDDYSQLAFWEQRIREEKLLLNAMFEDYCEYNPDHYDYNSEVLAVTAYRARLTNALIINNERTVD